MRRCPPALAADWLVSAWDQNAGMRDATPGVVGVEEVAAAWLLQLLGLPAGSAVGFATGATMANFTCLAAARDRVLGRAGWDVAADGLAGAPAGAGARRRRGARVGRAGAALPRAGRARAGRRRRPGPAGSRRPRAGGWRRADGPAIVCLQAGNIHSGAFDPMAAAVDVAHRAGAWVHVDGAFGLWAAVSPALAPLTDGLAGADSWATDAHKTLNTPYDGGIAIVADADAVHRAMGVHASYLLQASTVDPLEVVPEMSRRARGVPIWAALASLGADGVRDLVEGLVRAARGLAEGIGAIPGAVVLNDVVYTQVSVAFESDERTRDVFDRLVAEGTVMPSASVWHGRTVIRFSVSSWRTGDLEVRDTVAAVARAARAPVVSPTAVGE